MKRATYTGTSNLRVLSQGDFSTLGIEHREMQFAQGEDVLVSDELGDVLLDKLPHEFNIGVDAEEDAGEPDYNDMKVPELEAEIDRRNEGREVELEKPSKKKDLIAVLEADDADQDDDELLDSTIEARIDSGDTAEKPEDEAEPAS